MSSKFNKSKCPRQTIVELYEAYYKMSCGHVYFFKRTDIRSNFYVDKQVPCVACHFYIPAAEPTP